MSIIRTVFTPFALPLQWPLETARGVTRVREGLLVEVESAAGLRGYGEAMPLPGFGLEDLGVARATLARALPELLGEEAADLETNLALADSLTTSANSVRGALDSALHDLAARSQNLSIADLLAPGSGREVAVSALLAAKTPREVSTVAKRALEEGFRSVKLKVGATSVDRDLARVTRLREAVGEACALRLDANGGWEEATAARALRELALTRPEFVEQPVAASAIESLARLRAGSPVPVAADESLCQPGGPQALIEAGAADLMILKPAALGGFRATLSIAERAHDAGLGVVVTGFLDSAIGDAAALQLAAALSSTQHAAGLGSQYLFADDLAKSPVPEGGMRTLPSEPGLGVTPAPHQLARLATGPARVFEL